MNKARCQRVRQGIHQRYHDAEWGAPLHDDKKMFEFLLLDGAQAGLSWVAILYKRPAYRKAFEMLSPFLYLQNTRLPSTIRPPCQAVCGMSMASFVLLSRFLLIKLGTKFVIFKLFVDFELKIW